MNATADFNCFHDDKGPTWTYAESYHLSLYIQFKYAVN